MKYTSKRGTVINIPDGLNPKQIAAIKADADSGYGTRAQQTANQLGKKLGGGKPGKQPPVDDGNVDYFDKSGALKDPDMVIDGLTPTPDMDALVGNIGQSRDAKYNYLTRNFEQQRTRQLEDAKQEMAERGIPYNPAAATDPNSQDLYGRTIGGIERGWQDQYASASDQAYSSSLAEGTAAYNAAVGAAGQSNDAFLTAMLGMTDADLKKYGIDKDFIVKKMAVNKQGGGGGSGGGSSQPSGGFEIIA